MVKIILAFVYLFGFVVLSNWAFDGIFSESLFLANRFPLVYLIYIFHRGLYRLAFNLQKVYSIKPFDFEK